MPQAPDAPARRWWRERGEPRALTALALIAASLPPLVLLDLLAPDAARRAAVALAWAAGCLLLLRLPALLRGEGRRLGLLAALVAIGFGVAAGSLSPGGAAAQSAGLSFRAAPRISQASFSRILAAAGSPAAPHGDELYSIIVGYGLDPAVALAFFQHESQYCTTGRCARSDLKNWGMLRRHIKAHRNAGSTDGFARYATWQDGARDWCELILGYIGRGMDTVEKAVPVYAPTSDGNVPTAYIGAIRRLVAAWAGQPAGDLSLRSYDLPLDQALVAETFVAAEVEFHPTWAFHNYVLAEAHAGRPLGAPVDESRIISVGGRRYAVQVFALDTLFTPIAAV
ncbi:MAG TPA: hypothetical protein PKD53_34685, partial [Chloroflexaceae bacterium]|nr:hypothetical protein [Chloroflexaceae bacterium]